MERSGLGKASHWPDLLLNLLTNLCSFPDSLKHCCTRHTCMLPSQSIFHPTNSVYWRINWNRENSGLTEKFITGLKHPKLSRVGGLGGGGISTGVLAHLKSWLVSGMREDIASIRVAAMNSLFLLLLFKKRESVSHTFSNQQHRRSLQSVQFQAGTQRLKPLNQNPTTGKILSEMSSLCSYVLLIARMEV